MDRRSPGAATQSLVLRARSFLRRTSFGWLTGARRGRRRGLERLGTAYGGWWVPSEMVRPGTIAYCAGAGEDISFDIALLRRGCMVRTMDPTPRAIQHVTSFGLQDPRFQFAPVGVWSTDGCLRLYAPKDPRHVSHSVLNLQQTSSFLDVPVESLQTLMGRFGDERIDLLKLDIEGAEYEVLGSLTDLTPSPLAICVEFDQPQPFARARAAIRELRRVGYEPLTSEGFNVLLVRTD